MEDSQRERAPSSAMEDLQKALRAHNLAVSSLPEKGRCLLAARNFSPGEVIIRESPYACAPKPGRCDGCFAANDVKKCSACHVARFCGTKCQKEEWKLHRLECAALSMIDTFRSEAVTPSIRLMIRLCIRRKLETQGIIPASAMANYQLIEALVSHMTDIDEDQLVLYAQMANIVNMIIQVPDISIKEITENFSRLSCNAHTISDSELIPLGTGLYPVISMINHSCSANSVFICEGRTGVIRAVQHIEKGSEVLIGYIETTGNTVIRQKTLKEGYFFTCNCPRCIKLGQLDDIQETATLEGYRCKNSSCDGFLLFVSDKTGFVCQLCGLSRSKEEINNAVSEVKALSERANWSTTSEKAIALYKAVERLEVKLYHRFSISLMETRDKLVTMLIDSQDFSEALAYCKLTFPVYERVCPGFNPLLGLQYYTRAKLQWLLEDTENSLKSLTKAADILRITHGTTTPFMKELFAKLDETRAEAASKGLIKE